jgi:capsular exopolysaccharide synthesis family protein
MKNYDSSNSTYNKDDYGNNMVPEESLDLLQYWSIFRKHIKGILGLSVAVGILAMLVANSMTPIYKATTKISIEHVSPATGSYVDNSYYAYRNYPGTQYQIIKSRDVAEKTVEKLKLWEKNAFPEKNNSFLSYFNLNSVFSLFKSNSTNAVKTISDEEIIENKKNQLTSMVQYGISISPIKETYIVLLSFSSHDPKIAALVVNEHVNSYIERNLEERFSSIEKVSEWMSGSIGSITSQLKESETKLHEYRGKEDLLDVGSGATGLLTERIQELSSKLSIEKIALDEFRVLKRQANKYRSMPLEEVLNNPSIYRHPTLSQLKNDELKSANKVAEYRKRYGPKHPKMKWAITELDAIRGRYRELIPSIIKGIDEDYEVARQKYASLQKQFIELKNQLKDISAKGFQLDKLSQDVEGDRNLRDALLADYKKSTLSSNFETDRIRVIEPARVPYAPSAPNKRKIILMSMMLAFFAGLGLAFLVELLDQTIKTADDVEGKLKAATLGMLPKLNLKKLKKDGISPERIYEDDNSGVFSEVIRTIRTGVTLSSLDNPHKIILCTSSIPGEGKTTVACNLALSMSQLEKTLLFDADMRRPSTDKIFGYDHRSKGMSELLAGQAEFKEVIHRVEGTDLHMITAGSIPPDPLNLLASKSFRSLLEKMSKVYDRIIIDSPPVNLVSDAVLLSNITDGVVFVVKGGSTPTRIVQSALSKLKRSNATIIGVSVNFLDTSKMASYNGYGYGYGYGQQTYGYSRKAET